MTHRIHQSSATASALQSWMDVEHGEIQALRIKSIQLNCKVALIKA